MARRRHAPRNSDQKLQLFPRSRVLSSCCYSHFLTAECGPRAGHFRRTTAWGIICQQRASLWVGADRKLCEIASGNFQVTSGQLAGQAPQVVSISPSETLLKSLKLSFKRQNKHTLAKRFGGKWASSNKEIRCPIVLRPEAARLPAANGRWLVCGQVSPVAEAQSGFEASPLLWQSVLERHWPLGD